RRGHVCVVPERGADALVGREEGGRGGHPRDDGRPEALVEAAEEGPAVGAVEGLVLRGVAGRLDARDECLDGVDEDVGRQRRHGGRLILVSCLGPSIMSNVGLHTCQTSVPAPKDMDDCSTRLERLLGPLRPDLPLQLPQGLQHLIQHLPAPPLRQFPVGGPPLPRLAVAPSRLRRLVRPVVVQHHVVDARRADVGPRAGGEEARLADGVSVGAVDADGGEGVDGEVAWARGGLLGIYARGRCRLQGAIRAGRTSEICVSSISRKRAVAIRSRASGLITPACTARQPYSYVQLTMGHTNSPSSHPPSQTYPLSSACPPSSSRRRLRRPSSPPRRRALPTRRPAAPCPRCAASAAASRPQTPARRGRGRGAGRSAARRARQRRRARCTRWAPRPGAGAAAPGSAGGLGRLAAREGGAAPASWQSVRVEEAE
ncbi:Uncharacterized protein TPAR_08267, partial [Tolypocladium paradoxum]